MIDELSGIDRAESGHHVEAGTRRVAGLAWHRVVALHHVVKDRGAFIVILVVGKRVQHRIDEPLRLSNLLQDQAHDAGKERRRRRRTTGAHDLLIHIQLVRILDGGGKRQIRNVALAIGGNAKTELPRGLGVETADATTAGEQIATADTFVPR